MGAEILVAAILFVALPCAITSCVIANSKGYSAFGWLLLGGIFGIFALIAICAMPSLYPIETRPLCELGPSKLCDACRSWIPERASVCRFCRSKVAPA
jgi:hypothetical protein